MKLNDLLNPKMLSSLYLSGTTLDLTGPPGGGKSTVVRQFSEILSKIFGEEFGYHEELAPSIDAPDVRGFMIPSKAEDGTVVSHYTRPAVLPSKAYLDKHPRGVMFIDEFEQADQLTKKAFAPLILEGRLGNTSLPPGWWRVTASNRMQDRSGVAKPMMHIVNRRRAVEIQFDIDSWLAWASKYVSPKTGLAIHPMGLAFAKQQPQHIAQDLPTDPQPFCSPRSYVSAWDLITSVCPTDANGFVDMHVPEDPILWECVQGDVGQGVAAHIRSFAKVANEIPDMKDILSKPDTCKLPAPERLDAAFTVVQMCLHYITPQNLGAIWTYVERLPRELQTSTANSIMNSDKVGGALLNSPNFAKWISKNTALVAATQGN